MQKLWEYLKPYKKECLIGPFFKLLEAILELIVPTLMVLIINNGIKNRDTAYIFKIGGIMLFMVVLGFLCSMVCQYNAAKASQGFGTTLRNAMFRHISSLSHGELDKLGTSTLINRIINDVNQLQLAVAMAIRLGVRAPFIVLGAIAMAMILDFKLALILLAASPVFGIILYFIINRSSPLYRTYQQRLDKMGLVLKENLSGVRVIRAFARRDREEKRFQEANEDLYSNAVKVGRIASLLNPATSLVMNVAILLVLWFGAGHIQNDRLTQGEMIAFVNYITQIILTLVVISNQIILYTKAAASITRVNEVLNVKPSVVEKSSGTGVPDLRVPAVVFSNVSFAYSKTGDRALSNINITIPRGRTVGIIGSTGSGKSTFINLIPRFYDVTEGHIEVDGMNVKDYSLEALRRKIGLVPQKALLFSGTVAENIRWGRENASEEAIRNAAKVAQAAEFIEKLPQGYDSTVSRGGVNFSGGQKQRLSIARAIAAQPEILILDDSASALDQATDAALRKAIAEHFTDTTVLIVSQRISSVRHADSILVFDDGRIVGQGTHDSLLKECETYREIYHSQTKEEEERA